MQNTPVLEHFWKLTCRKSARGCGAKHVSKSRVLKTDGLGTLLEVDMSKKCTSLWREAHFEVKSAKNERYGALLNVLLDVQMSFCVSRAGVGGPCSSFQNDGRRGTLEEDLQRCMSRGRRSTRDMVIRDLRRSGH